MDPERDGSPGLVLVRGAPGGAAVAARQSCEDGVLERVAVYAVDALGAPDPEGARELLEAAERQGFDALLAEHRDAWAQRWESCDVVLAGDPELQLALRLAMFHLISLIEPTGEAAVGARGMTGHVYGGHVFWDADVFVLPFAAATYPAAARAMLRYRARRLRAARAYATDHGHAGARFPWESAATGEEATPRQLIDHRGEVVEVRTGALQEHVTADVAWAADHYLAWTGDEEFARGDGMAILVESARYWQSRVERDADGSCHVRNVIGPDEYHEHVDDNAYTNVMAGWNLRTAAAHVTRHGGGVDERELRNWLATADAIVDGYDPRTRIYEQFSGFFEREPLVAADVAHRPFSAPRLLGYERTAGSQVVKQNDVLMLHLNVPNETAPGSLEPNLDFYEPRTCHESSLSPGFRRRGAGTGRTTRKGAALAAPERVHRPAAPARRAATRAAHRRHGQHVAGGGARHDGAAPRHRRARHRPFPAARVALARRARPLLRVAPATTRDARRRNHQLRPPHQGPPRRRPDPYRRAGPAGADVAATPVAIAGGWRRSRTPSARPLLALSRPGFDGDRVCWF